MERKRIFHWNSPNGNCRKTRKKINKWRFVNFEWKSKFLNSLKKRIWMNFHIRRTIVTVFFIGLTKNKKKKFKEQKRRILFFVRSIEERKYSFLIIWTKFFILFFSPSGFKLQAKFNLFFSDTFNFRAKFRQVKRKSKNEIFSLLRRTFWQNWIENFSFQGFVFKFCASRKRTKRQMGDERKFFAP